MAGTGCRSGCRGVTISAGSSRRGGGTSRARFCRSTSIGMWRRSATLSRRLRFPPLRQIGGVSHRRKPVTLAVQHPSGTRHECRGCKGNTRQELVDLIGAPDSIEEQNQQFARLLQSVYDDGKRPFELAMANALWGQKGIRFDPGFQEAIADFYDGALHEVDFHAKPGEAMKNYQLLGQRQDENEERSSDGAERFPSRNLASTVGFLWAGPC